MNTGAAPKEVEPVWLTNLRNELPLTPMKSGFTLTRDELQYLVDRLAAPSKEAGAAGEFLGWVHECVWKDGTSRSLHQREPKLMDAIEPDGSPLAGLVSQRIVRVYANPPGDQRQEGNPCVECGAGPGERCGHNCCCASTPPRPQRRSVSWSSSSAGRGRGSAQRVTGTAGRQSRRLSK